MVVKEMVQLNRNKNLVVSGNGIRDSVDRRVRVYSVKSRWLYYFERDDEKIELYGWEVFRVRS